MLSIVLISQIVRRILSMISRSCLFFSCTIATSSRFSWSAFLYSSVCTGSDRTTSPFSGIRLSMCVYSMPCWQVSLHLSYSNRNRLNSSRIVRNCSWTFAFLSLLDNWPWLVPFGG
uniref:Putative secreted protein n=1 Tax=Anopheles darlingi TaxID=43151 RepID=A0A2M4D4K8_ANODA